MKKREYDKTVCFYFQVHQPYRLSKCNAFEVGNKENYFKGPAHYENKAIFEKIAHKCYLPGNALILELLNRYPEFRVGYSFSGVFLEQCLQYGDIGKEVLDSFKKIIATGRAEILSETYYHSLAWLYSKKEFAEQIISHKKLIYKIFRKKPTVFRNTELIYSDEIAEFIREMGFKGILAEGWDYYLDQKSPNFVYTPRKTDLHPADRKIARKMAISKKPVKDIALLLKNYKLSDDIAFRFSDKQWKEWPLTTDKYSDWIAATQEDTLNLFMDYETFGEHQWEDTGIFDFMKHLPEALLRRNIGFKTPSETIRSYEIKSDIHVPHLMSWADMERDLSAWVSNPMQESALARIFDLETLVNKTVGAMSRKEADDMLNVWRKLQTSDHFYYMCTKWFNDGDVHKYFNAYDRPHDAFIAFMNVIADLKIRLREGAN